MMTRHVRRSSPRSNLFWGFSIYEMASVMVRLSIFRCPANSSQWWLVGEAFIVIRRLPWWLCGEAFIFIRWLPWWLCGEAFIVIRRLPWWLCGEAFIVIRLLPWWLCGEAFIVIRLLPWWLCGGFSPPMKWFLWWLGVGLHCYGMALLMIMCWDFIEIKGVGYLPDPLLF